MCVLRDLTNVNREKLMGLVNYLDEISSVLPV